MTRWEDGIGVGVGAAGGTGVEHSRHIVDGMVPKHEQLRGRLTELAARLPAGSPRPGERQLCVEHGVSRITVRSTPMPWQSAKWYVPHFEYS